MQLNMDAWLRYGGRAQEGTEEQREVQGTGEARKRRGIFREEVSRCPLEGEAQRISAPSAEEGGRTSRENRVWDRGHPSAWGLSREFCRRWEDRGGGIPTESQAVEFYSGTAPQRAPAENRPRSHYGSQGIGDIWNTSHTRKRRCTMPHAQDAPEDG